MRSSLAVFIVFLSGCVPPASTPTKTSDLVPQYTISQVAPTLVQCVVGFTVAGDSTNTLVALEADALATCNQQPMIFSNNTYYVVVPYVTGQRYTISVVRPVDGSTTLDSVVLP